MTPEDWMRDPLDGAEPGPEMNLTPLVDVVFALLIVFMVTSAAIVEQGMSDAASGQIELALPTGDSSAQKAPAMELVVQVDADGSQFIDGQATDDKRLSDEVMRRLATKPDLQVRVEADSKLSYQRVMDVILRLQTLGVRNVGLATRDKGK